MNRILPYRLLLGALLTLTLLASCDDGVGPDPDVIPPGVGSSYMLVSVNDPLGTPDIDTIVATVTQTKQTIFARNNVVVFKSDVSSQPLYLIYESNGDISVFTTGQNSTHSTGGNYFHSPDAWITLPFGSRKSETRLVDWDTTGVIDGRTETFAVRHTVEFVGTEQMQVGSETLTVAKVVEKIGRLETTAAADYSVEYVRTYWYSPKAGFFVRADHKRTDSAGNLDEGSSRLDEYVRK